MDIGNKIAFLRKQNHLTQEQLADAVGVSVPAVSKWEHGVTIPDVSLLSPIARMLHTDVNELLSFQENLSWEEVDRLMAQVKQICKKEGYRTGIAKAFEYLKEYPNNNYLKLEVASAVGMYAFTAEEDLEEAEFQKWMDKSTELFEEVYEKEENSQLKSAAAAALASRYMQSGKLEEAEKLLTGMPSQGFDGTHMLSVVYYQQGNLKKAREATQVNLLKDIQNLMSDIRSLYCISIKEKDFSRALLHAQDYYHMGKVMPFLSWYPSALLTEACLLNKDMDKALEHFSDYADEIIQAKENYKSSICFDAIQDSIAVWSSDGEEDIRISMYRVFSEDPMYQPLLKREEGQEIVKRLRDSFGHSTVRRKGN